MKQSVKMMNRIMKIVSPWTNNLDECDGRNLNGVAITIEYKNESVKEAPARFWDYAEVTIQDVRWDGSRSRHERDIYIVCHDGSMSKC